MAVRVVTVVSQATGESSPAGADRLAFSRLSCTTSSASAIDPSIR